MKYEILKEWSLQAYYCQMRPLHTYQTSHNQDIDGNF